tara:strand:- start:504 stop:1877 length:1374 start_codon:yes stop_codon:yes gene_type:complete
MKVLNNIEKLFKSYIPNSFTIAVCLTLITILCAFIFTNSEGEIGYLLEICSYWENGLWNNSLLVFAYQMILILILGHILVLSSPVSYLIDKLTVRIKSSSQAVVILSTVTLFAAFFNWGFGLILGAIFTRTIGEHCKKNNIKIYYPLLGAAGYVGLMVWHGGISGSAPIKASEKNHIKELMTGVTDNSIINSLPSTIGLNETVFSTSNLVTYGFIFVIIPLVFWVINKLVKPKDYELEIYDRDIIIKHTDVHLKIDKSKTVAYIFGGFILITLFFVHSDKILSLEISPNILNLFMLGCAIIMHQNFISFLSALKNAISGAAGILIQFPLYFGIMGIMKQSGLVLLMSEFFISISNQTTLPIYTLISAGIVNILVPSGGGQWAVQGPIIIDAAINLGVPIQKVIMALAYGDQLTNMLQPFWALPLLAITGLKAKDILPFSLIAMVVGGLIFITSLLVI